MRLRASSLPASLGVALALGVATLPAPPALAASQAPVLVSGSSTIQADYAYSPAISAEATIAAGGRSGYVVFTGSVDSVRGVYRKDLQTEALELVAEGDAGAPSISADGRYVSFTASQNPATGEPECSAVWVRDMEPGPGEPEYELASALNDSTQSLTYAGSGKPDCPGGGSAAASRVALSASGRAVAFTVIGESDLGATIVPGEPPPVTSAPPDQVVVRNLATNTTTLVSATLPSQEPGATPEPVPGGAALAGDEVDKGGSLLAGVQEDTEEHPVSASTAAISADGSTVAWMGVNIPEQAPAAAEDEAVAVGDKYTDDYDEPLWRGIAAGSNTPTRRILGGDDPASPTGEGPLNLHWNGTTTGSPEPADVGPERGAYIELKNFDEEERYQDATKTPTFESITPQLSANGETVALLSTAPPSGSEPTYGAGIKEPTIPPSANAFIVNMASGLTRSQALIPLTEWGADDFGPDLANTAPIGDIALSSDGTRVAFTTERTIFPLTPPVLITPQVSTTADSQLYEIDLRSNTLALVSEGYEGSPAEGDVYSPSFNGDGDTLAFASEARNLVYGAVNSGGSDVFAVSAEATPEAPGQQSIASLPSDPFPAPQWLLSATARHGAGGSLLLDVTVPGAGALRAAASAAVPATATAKRSAARERAHKSTAAQGSTARVRATAHPTIVTRTLAHAGSTTAAAGLLQLRLLPASRYRSLEESRGGLYATIRITFAAGGHKELAQTLQASFELTVPAHSTPRKTTHSRTAKRRSSRGTRAKQARRGT